MDGNNLQPIKFDPQEWAKLDFDQFVQQLAEKLGDYRQTHFERYDGLRRKNSYWANNSRWMLAVLGAAALVLTGVAAAFRLAPESLVKWADWDKPALVAVLVIYAVMAAIAFFEKTTDKTTSYFRHLTLILAIRDLWTRLQFELLKEVGAVYSAADRKAAEGLARERIGALGKAFCEDLNKISAAEMTEWKTEFLASLSELSEAAKKGTEDVTKQVQEIAKAAKEFRHGSEGRGRQGDCRSEGFRESRRGRSAARIDQFRLFARRP